MRALTINEPAQVSGGMLGADTYYPGDDEFDDGDIVDMGQIIVTGGPDEVVANNATWWQAALGFVTGFIRWVGGTEVERRAGQAFLGMR